MKTSKNIIGKQVKCTEWQERIYMSSKLVEAEIKVNE